MRYLSLLRDSVKESLDRKSFIITLIFCSILILTCATVGFEPYPMAKSLQSRVQGFRMHYKKDPTTSRNVARAFQIRYRVTEAIPIGDGWSARIEATPVVDFQKMVLAYQGIESGAIRTEKDPIPGVSPDSLTVLSPPSAEAIAAFIENKMTGIQAPGAKVAVEDVDAHRVALRVRFKPAQPEMYEIGHRVNVLFGSWTIDLEYTQPSDSVYFIQKLAAGVLVGWAGILAGIVLTAAFIPDMLQKGMIDLVLSRPVRRWKVFLMKYVGGLTYVFATAGFLIGGCWIALGLRSGTWAPGFLLAIPLLVFFFAAIYCVSAFIGLHKRNTTEAIMVAVVAWLGLTSLGAFRTYMHDPRSGVDAGSAWVKVIDTAHAVTPPLREIDTAVSWILMKSNGITPERTAATAALQGRPGSYPEPRWAHLFGVTLAWMAFLLGLSCWTFSRRDY